MSWSLHDRVSSSGTAGKTETWDASLHRIYRIYPQKDPDSWVFSTNLVPCFVFSAACCTSSSLSLKKMMDAAKKNMYGMASLIALISQLDSSSTKSAHHLWDLDLKMFDASSPLGAHKSVPLSSTASVHMFAASGSLTSNNSSQWIGLWEILIGKSQETPAFRPKHRNVRMIPSKTNNSGIKPSQVQVCVSINPPVWRSH